MAIMGGDYSPIAIGSVTGGLRGRCPVLECQSGDVDGDRCSSSLQRTETWRIAFYAWLFMEFTKLTECRRFETNCVGQGLKSQFLFDFSKRNKACLCQCCLCIRQIFCVFDRFNLFLLAAQKQNKRAGELTTFINIASITDGIHFNVAGGCIYRKN